MSGLSDRNDINAVNYKLQLDEKLKNLQLLLSGYNLPKLKVYKSPIRNFRMRAEFRIWHEDNIAHYAMNYPGENKVYLVDNYPIGSIQIKKVMKPLLKMINMNDLLKYRLFTIEFLSSQQNELLVTLIYHKALNSKWIKAAESIREKLKINIIGRSRKQKLVVGESYISEILRVNNKTYYFQIPENCFSQPNTSVNKKIISWIENIIPSHVKSKDALELYCGIGNFTMMLSKKFRWILATEVSKLSLATAKINQLKNKASNIQFARLSSNETYQAMTGFRQFRRLKDIDLKKYEFEYIFVDPPRSGLDDQTLSLVKHFNNIIYISCNPKTLEKNLNYLLKTHQIKSLAAFDQFPWTNHLETGVWLSKSDNFKGDAADHLKV